MATCRTALTGRKKTNGHELHRRPEIGRVMQNASGSRPIGNHERAASARHFWYASLTVPGRTSFSVARLHYQARSTRPKEVQLAIAPVWKLHMLI